MSNLSGVTYFKLSPGYPGDVTKKCSLTGSEIDKNFYFLRGNDISNAYFDNENFQMVLEKVNGDKIFIDQGSIKQIIDLSGTTYNKEEGILTLSVNGTVLDVTGFTIDKPSCCEDVEALKEWVGYTTAETPSIICRVETAEGNIENIYLELDNENKKISGLTKSLEDLDDKIDTLDSKVDAEVETLDKKIDKETTNRTYSETLINDEIKGLWSAIEVLTTGETAQVSALTKMITEVDKKVDTEKNEREQADEALQDEIDNVNKKIDKEIEDRESGDKALQKEIDDLSSSFTLYKKDTNERLDKIEEDIESIKIEPISGSPYKYTLYVDGEERGTITIPPADVLKDAYLSGSTLVLVFITSGGKEKKVEIPLSEIETKSKTTKDIYITNDVGGYAVGETIPSGTSFEDIFVNILSGTREIKPTVTQPSVSISYVGISSGYYPLGDIKEIKYKVNFNPGSYTYNETEVTYTNVLVKDTNGNELNTLEGTISEELYITEGLNYNVSVELAYSDGAIPVSNKGTEYPELRIKSGTTTASTGKIISYLPYYYGSFDTVHKTFSKELFTNYTSASTFTMDVNEGDKQIVIAIPKNSGKTLKSVLDINALSQEMVGNFENVETIFKYFDETVNETYVVWYYNPKAAYIKDSLKITIG